MCKLLVGVNNSQKNSKEFEKLITFQYPVIRTEPHGVGAVVITKDDKLHIFREYAHYDKVFDKVSKLLKTAKFVSIHSRQSTGGTTNLTNVHFFEYGDYMLAHNGWVPKYAERYWGMNLIHDDNRTEEEIDKVVLNPSENVKTRYKDNGLCDSYKFLKNLPDKVNVDTLKSYVGSTKFFGFAVIINKKTHDIFLIIKKEVKCVTDKKDFSVFCSYKPETSMVYVNYETLAGVDIIESEEKIKIQASILNTIEGIYKLKY